MPAREVIAPADELTGFPLPIVVNEGSLEDWQPDRLTWHHPFHPNSAPELQGLGGRAVRSCRLQQLPARLHNLGKGSYHSLFTKAQLPAVEDTEQQFFLTVLACAGFVPRRGIDMTKDNPEDPVELSSLHRAFMRTVEKPKPAAFGEIRRFFDTNASKSSYRMARNEVEERHKRQAENSYRYFHYNYTPIRDFFSDYLIHRQVDVDSKDAKKFLSVHDESKRRELGEIILRMAASRASSGITERINYRALHEAGLLHPNAAPHPQQLIYYKLGNSRTRLSAIARLQEHLELQYAA